MRNISQLPQLRLPLKNRLSSLLDFLKVLPKNISDQLNIIKCIGVTEEMSPAEQSKLRIFNQLNFFQFITGIIVPVAGLLNASKFPITGWIVICLPALVSILVLVLNHYRRHELALLTYFVLYPFFICI